MGTFAKMFSHQEVLPSFQLQALFLILKTVAIGLFPAVFLHLNLYFHLVTGEGGRHCGRRPGAREGAFSGAVQERGGALCSG